MTVIDIDSRARRRGADPAVYRTASRHFVILRARALSEKTDKDPISLLKQMPDDEVIAMVRYNGHDKKYPGVFDRNGFIEH